MKQNKICEIYIIHDPQGLASKKARQHTPKPEFKKKITQFEEMQKKFPRNNDAI